jgi:hypothetical protein
MWRDVFARSLLYLTIITNSGQIVESVCQVFYGSAEVTLGTHRFQRAVSARDVLIGSRRFQYRRNCAELSSLAILRIRDQSRCGPPMGLLTTPPRWKWRVPRARAKLLGAPSC